MFENLHAYVLKKLDATRGTWPQVSEGSGVPLRTIEKIARQETEDPRVSNVQKLADWFASQDTSPPNEGGHAPQ